MSWWIVPKDPVERAEAIKQAIASIESANPAIDKFNEELK